TWQWQLTGTIDTSVNAEMYDIDLFTTPQGTIDALHAAGRIVICYLSAGTYEPGRPDSSSIPQAARGNGVDGWPGEEWLDTRDATVRQIMTARMDLAVQKKCDGVEPDNVDGYQNNPGFPLTSSTQLDYNKFLASEAHSRGLSVGLKNDLDQVDALQSSFDWALNEECSQYSECNTLAPFTQAGKAVFHAEYSSGCPAAVPGLSTIVKHLSLDAYRLVCP
ncbi:MAG TPA: endo alpha-1,4 polygalactosaminidase, partial [Polyangiaceae bacterium]|nr:endo alpha-1,4 polygalactosaminidase [Polyangiaceae bacterium]